MKSKQKKYLAILSFGCVVGLLVPSPVLPKAKTPVEKQASQHSPPQNYNLTEGGEVKIPAKSAEFPFYVYGENPSQKGGFVASGYMGDGQGLSLLTSVYDASAPASIGRTGKTSLKITYEPKGSNGWAGVYWLTPANNWGQRKGAGFDLSKATSLTFWVCGEKGNEKISQIKIGGVNGPYPDSDSISYGPLDLSKEWEQHTIDLTGKDLRHIVGGFMFIVKRSDNIRGATFYFDEIVFHSDAPKKGSTD